MLLLYMYVLLEIKSCVKAWLKLKWLQQHYSPLFADQNSFVNKCDLILVDWAEPTSTVTKIMTNEWWEPPADYRWSKLDKFTLKFWYFQKTERKMKHHHGLSSSSIKMAWWIIFFIVVRNIIIRYSLWNSWFLTARCKQWKWPWKWKWG